MWFLYVIIGRNLCRRGKSIEAERNYHEIGSSSSINLKIMLPNKGRDTTPLITNIDFTLDSSFLSITHSVSIYSNSFKRRGQYLLCNILFLTVVYLCGFKTLNSIDQIPNNNVYIFNYELYSHGHIQVYGSTQNTNILLQSVPFSFTVDTQGQFMVLRINSNFRVTLQGKQVLSYKCASCCFIAPTELNLARVVLTSPQLWR